MAGSIGISKLGNYLIGTGAALVGSVALTYLPNTIGVKYARQYFQATMPYCKSINAEPETVALLNEVIQDINAAQVRPVRKDGIEFLQTNTFYPLPFHKGKSSSGAIIGLPIGTRCNAEDVFYYHCPDTVSLEMAKFCLLSNAGKKFLMAREIYYVEDSYIMFRCLLGLALVVTGSILHYFLNSMLKSLNELKFQILTADTKGKDKSKVFEKANSIIQWKALRQRWFTFVVISIGFVQIYHKIRNFYNWELERSTDEKVATLGPEYRKGGLEYYKKIVEAGKFDNSHHSENSFCDAAGNLNQGKYPVLFKHVPHTQRYRYFAMLAPQEEQGVDTDS